MKISAICFDLGKVLLHFDWQIMLQRIAKKTPLPPEEVARRLKEDPQIIAYEIGGISSTKFFSHLKKSLEYKGSAKELRSAFSEIFTPLPEHIALAAQLAPHYPMAIISNTNEAHIVHAEANYSFFSLFHARIYSHEVKTMKPKREIYDAALAALGGIDPVEALFIDDLEPNILGASQLGWQTIHLRPDVDLRTALASYELKGLDLALERPFEPIVSLEMHPSWNASPPEIDYLGKSVMHVETPGKTRDASLPKGISDLGELIAQQQETERAVEEFKGHLELYCKSFVPDIYNILSSQIDHDLLFTPQEDLVLPKIREVSKQFVRSLTPKNPDSRDEKLFEKLVDIVTEQVRIHIARLRPKAD